MTFPHLNVIQKLDFSMMPNSRVIFCRCHVSWRRQCDLEARAPGMRSSFRPRHCCFSGEELASHLISLCLDFLTYKTGMIISALLPTGHCEKVYVHITRVLFLCATQLYETIANTTQGAPCIKTHIKYDLKKKKRGRSSGFYKLYVETLHPVPGTKKAFQ